MDISKITDASFLDLLEQKHILAWILVIIAAVFFIMAIQFLIKVISKRLKIMAVKTEFVGDNILAGCLAETRMWFVAMWIIIPLILLVDKSETTTKFGRGLLVIACCIQFIIWGLQAILEWKNQVWVKKVEHNASSAAAFGLIYSALKAVLVIGFFLMALSNLGVNIGALITGLGIGGIAVALAAQNVLGDLFASLSIVLDKPFVVGDFISVGNDQGEVETIGIKTTRVRSLTGEELIFANKDLLDSRVRNFKRMWRRRVAMTIDVSYTTPLDKVKNIPDWIKSYFDKYSKLSFERCHFIGYGETALKFELVYWVDDPDYTVFMDLQQSLLLDIYGRFESEEIEFGLPSRSIRIDNDFKDLLHINPTYRQVEPPRTQAETGN